MAWKKNNPGCNVMGMFSGGCCCEPSCGIASDDFESNSIGNWSTSGSVSISGGVMTLAGSSEAIYNVSDPTALGNQRTTWDIVGTTDGDEVEAIIGRLDGSNYLFAKLTFGASGKLELFSRSGGSDGSPLVTLFNDLPTGTTLTLTVCVADSVFSASEGVTKTAVSTTSGTAFGGLCGIATASGVTVTVDNFVFEHSAEISTYPTCPACNICHADGDTFIDDFSTHKPGYFFRDGGGTWSHDTGTLISPAFDGQIIWRCVDAIDDPTDLVIEFSLNIVDQNVVRMQIDNSPVYVEWQPGGVWNFIDDHFFPPDIPECSLSETDNPRVTLLCTSTSGWLFDVSLIINGRTISTYHNINLSGTLHSAGPTFIYSVTCNSGGQSIFDDWSFSITR